MSLWMLLFACLEGESVVPVLPPSPVPVPVPAPTPVPSPVPPTPVEDCDNGVDDDQNGRIDCVDAACIGVGDCPLYGPTTRLRTLSSEDWELICAQTTEAQPAQTVDCGTFTFDFPGITAEEALANCLEAFSQSSTWTCGATWWHYEQYIALDPAASCGDIPPSVIELASCFGLPTPPPVPTGHTGDTATSCGGTPPVLVSAEVTNASDPGGPGVVGLTYTTSDADGDLLPGTYSVVLDTQLDGNVDLVNGLVFNAQISGSGGCADSSSTLTLLLEPGLFDMVDDCTTYDFAMFVQDAQDQPSNMIVVTATTPAADGTDCIPDTGVPHPTGSPGSPTGSTGDTGSPMGSTADTGGAPVP